MNREVIIVLIKEVTTNKVINFDKYNYAELRSWLDTYIDFNKEKLSTSFLERHNEV